MPDCCRTTKGHIKHRLGDMIILTILARLSKCVERADIIAFGEHNLNATSLDGTAERMGSIARRHWSIESMHWGLDRNLLQDDLKRKKPRSARNLDTMQRMVLSLLGIWKRRRKKRADKSLGTAELARKLSKSFTKLMRFFYQK